jgi:hypothetical protein
LDDSNPLVGLHCLAASNLLLAGTSSFAKFAKFLSLGTTVDPLNNNGYSDFVPPVDDTAIQGKDEEADECDKGCNRVRAAKARLAVAQRSNITQKDRIAIYQATKNLRKAERKYPNGGKKESSDHLRKVRESQTPAVGPPGGLWGRHKMWQGRHEIRRWGSLV